MARQCIIPSVKKEKRKRSREADSLMGLLIEKLVEAQTTSDMRMMKMEEKWMKFEE